MIRAHRSERISKLSTLIRAEGNLNDTTGEVPMKHGTSCFAIEGFSHSSKNQVSIIEDGNGATEQAYLHRIGTAASEPTPFHPFCMDTWLI